jgi:hypothetical protein
MTALETTYADQVAPSHAPTDNAALPILSEVPRLLEYRSDSDPDAEFIPKTVAGFAGGSVAMFITLFLLESVIFRTAFNALDFWRQVAFMMGIVGVTTSLLLVGLKVRADHYPIALYARHWLNSIGTGAASATMIWLPWVLIHHDFVINRYLAAVIWMVLVAFPAVAAKWTIAPHPDHVRPE